jgi:HAE1 family hydrophobic/amphiphilic exporter-1
MMRIIAMAYWMMAPSVLVVKKKALSGSEYKSELLVKLVEKEKRTLSTEKYMIEIGKRIETKFPGVKLRSTTLGIVNSGEPIQIILNSTNNELLMKTANELKRKIETLPGANDVSLSVEEGNPEVEVDIDRDKLAQLGLDIATVGATMQNAYSGNTDAKYRVGTNEYDINIKFDNFDKRNAGDVSNICFINNKGQQIRLTQFANVEQGSGPSVLERKDRRTSVTVKSNVLGMTSGILADEINKSLLEKPLPSTKSAPLILPAFQASYL